MSTEIQYAGVIFKDENGNVGKVNGLSETDVTTVQTALDDMIAVKEQASNAIKTAGKAEAQAEANLEIINNNLVPHLVALDNKVGVVVDTSTSPYSAVNATSTRYGAVRLATGDTTQDTGNAVVPDINLTKTLIENATPGASQYKSVAQMHNHIYRGADLLSDGHFSDLPSLLTAIRNGDFSDIYVGDTITTTVDYMDAGVSLLVTFAVAGLDLIPNVNGRSGMHNVCLVNTAPLFSQSYSMNNSATSAGGFKGSAMYTETLPVAVNSLAGNTSAPFYGYLLTHNERLSSAVNETASSMAYPGWTGASSDLTAVDVSVNLLSDVEVFGAPICSSSCYDNATVVKLPLFDLFENDLVANNFQTSFWLRNVSNSTSFGVAQDLFTPTSGVATASHGLVVRFFIG